MPFIIPLLLAGSLSPFAIPIDFKLQTARVQPPAVSAGPPIEDDGSATGSAGSSELPYADRPHFLVARGFGHDVPLAFAARQIVPQHVRISFGSDVDPEARVNWEGGKPWDDVLRAAVKPLGLHLAVTHMAVKIVD